MRKTTTLLKTTFLDKAQGMYKLTDVFTDILNISLNSAVLPTCLKTTTILPMPKISTVSFLNDYHPVALKSTIIKCYKRLVLRHIKALLQCSLDPLQLVFHPNHSTDNAIGTTLHLTLTHLDKKYSYICIHIQMVWPGWFSVTRTVSHQIEKRCTLKSLVTEQDAGWQPGTTCLLMWPKQTVVDRSSMLQKH